MVKSKGLVFKGFYSFNALVENAPYLVKWNAKEALSWLEEARMLVETEIQEKSYNKAVERVNNFLDSYEKKSYYDKKEVWGIYPSDRAIPYF